MKTFKQIQADIKRLAKMIKLPAKMFSKLWFNHDLSEPYILVEGNLYLYLATERGVETLRFETSDYDRLLYTVFNDLTYDHASYLYLDSADFSVNNDERLFIFPLQQKMMEKLSPHWAKKCKASNNYYLRKYP